MACNIQQYGLVMGMVIDPSVGRDLGKLLAG